MIVLVATPALIRDFSPQLGRATAMGYWTMGPVIGSPVVTVVTSSTLPGASAPPVHRMGGREDHGSGPSHARLCPRPTR
ncbi:hypothetical protein [Streptomyces sp. NPDC054783]